jgi:hypothetical protein
MSEEPAFVEIEFSEIAITAAAAPFQTALRE